MDSFAWRDDRSQRFFLFFRRKLELAVIHELFHAVQEKPTVRAEHILQFKDLHFAHLLRRFLQNRMHIRYPSWLSIRAYVFP